jgi:hypothetical protein
MRVAVSAVKRSPGPAVLLSSMRPSTSRAQATWRPANVLMADHDGPQANRHRLCVSITYLFSSAAYLTLTGIGVVALPSRIFVAPRIHIGDRGSERGNCNQEQHAADCRKIHRTGRNLLDPQLWSAIRPTAKAASAAKLARKDSVANTATVWATCSTLFLARSKHVLQGQYEPPPLGPECRTIALAAPPTSCRSEPRQLHARYSPIPWEAWLGRPQRKQPAPLSAMSLAAVLTCPATSRADLAVSSLARDLSFATVSLGSLKSLCSACPRESAKRAAREHSCVRSVRCCGLLPQPGLLSLDGVPDAIGGATAF